MSPETKENPMREIKIEKLILSCGGVKEDLDRYYKLISTISGMKPIKKQTVRRIPGFGIRPKMEVGCMVTIRSGKAEELLARLLSAVENQLKKKQIADNHFSFGIEEYINIPGEKYDREIGMAGLKVTIVFARKGKRVARKKIKKGKIAPKQIVPKQEIIKFMEENFETEFY